jgi:hypothetical protein
VHVRLLFPGAKRIGSFFRFLIKEPIKNLDNPINDERKADNLYTWHRLGFFTSWKPSNTSIVLCFDLPPSLKHSLSTFLMNPATRLHLDDPFAFHAVLTEEITAMYDKALWSWRDLVRDLEKV